MIDTTKKNFVVSRVPWTIEEEYTEFGGFGTYDNNNNEFPYDELEKRTRYSLTSILNNNPAFVFGGTVAKGYSDSDIALPSLEGEVPITTAKFLNEDGILKANVNYQPSNITDEEWVEDELLEKFQQEHLKLAQITYIEAQLSGWRPHYDLKQQVNISNGPVSNTQSAFQYADDFDSLPNWTKMHLRAVQLTKFLSDRKYKLYVAPEDYLKIEYAFDSVIKLTKDEYPDVIINNPQLDINSQLDFNLAILKLIDDIIVGGLSSNFVSIDNPTEEMLDPLPALRTILDGNVQALANKQFVLAIRQNEVDIQDKVSLTAFLQSQLAQDILITDNASQVSLLGLAILEKLDITTFNSFIDDNYVLTIANLQSQIDALNDAVGQLLQQSNKVSSNAVVNIPPGSYGFDLSNGNNWLHISGAVLEPFNTNRQDDAGNDIWGYELATGNTFTGSYELLSRLWFEFGSLTGTDGATIYLDSYLTKADANAGTNVAKETIVGEFAISDRFDNKTLPFDIQGLFSSNDGLFLVLRIETVGTFPVGLQGNTTNYQSYIRFLTNKTNGNIVGNDDVNILSTSALPDLISKNQFQINEFLDNLARANETNITNLSMDKANVVDVYTKPQADLLLDDKLEKGLIGTTRTTRQQYNSFGELETFSYDNITGIGFKSKVKPDGIIVSDWNNNTGTATDYTQSEPGSLTSKKYVDDLIVPLATDVAELSEQILEE